LIEDNKKIDYLTKKSNEFEIKNLEINKKNEKLNQIIKIHLKKIHEKNGS